MWLLAQEVPLDWSRAFLAYGPLGVIAGFFLYFLYRYGTRMADGHIEFMSTAKECLSQNTKTLDALTASMMAHERNCSKVPKMLGHLAEAGKAITDDQDAKRYLDQALFERDR